MVRITRWTYITILAVISITLLAGGGLLAYLGGSLYYLGSGSAIAITAMLLAKQSARTTRLRRIPYFKLGLGSPGVRWSFSGAPSTHGHVGSAGTWLPCCLYFSIKAKNEFLFPTQKVGELSYCRI